MHCEDGTGKMLNHGVKKKKKTRAVEALTL
jgi:hypothetical protein